MCMPVISIEKSCEKLRSLCVSKGYTPQMLKEALQLESVQTIYKWFSGQNIPNIDNLVALSRLLGVSLDELIVTNDVEL